VAPSLEGIARSIAEGGAVVYLAQPTAGDLTLAPEMARAKLAAIGCALRFAAVTAQEHGGSVEHLVLVGYGHDTWAGALTVLRGADVDPQPCVVAGGHVAPAAFVGAGGALGCLSQLCPAGRSPSEAASSREFDPRVHADGQPEVDIHLFLPSHGTIDPQHRRPEEALEDYRGFERALRHAGHEAELTVLPGTSPGDLEIPGPTSRQLVERILTIARG
jgi:hypothetical protein